MIAVDDDRTAVRTFDLLDEGVLTVAGIYGPNASGKSNILDALAWLSAAAGRSLRAWDEFIPRDPFKFRNGEERPTTFDVDLMVKGSRYNYHLSLTSTEVAFEGLYHFPLGKQRTLFEREGVEGIKFRRGTENAAGTRELLTPTTLALSAATRLGDPEIREFGRALSRIGFLDIRRRRVGKLSTLPVQRSGFSTTEQLFMDRSEYYQPTLADFEDPDPFSQPSSAISLLQFADLGIDDVEVVTESAGEEGEAYVRRYVRLIHNVGGQKLAFNMADESEGTKTWFRLIGPTLRALRDGQILLFDEIDASLHPKLSAKLIELFQDPVTNRHGAQLIFTSHDTSLLNHLNRDEVWLTEKRLDGSTTLSALAEYGGEKVRRSLNLEKAYLQGRFGAVPELDQRVLKRALGLAGSSE